MNSPLVSHTEISPNRTTPRNHKIDTITIHCTAGHINVRALGKLFSAKGRMASSNYGIDDLGHIALYVDEADRSWCSSNAANDNRAVTIEVSSDDTAPYAVTAEAFSSLIYLVADICKRNGIQKLRWFHDKALVGKQDDKGELIQNMTLHKWFKNKACPGQYLEERMFEIAAKVNALL